MAKFIKLHQGNDTCIVNARYIISVEPSKTDTYYDEDGELMHRTHDFPTIVWCRDDNSVEVNESPDEIWEMLKSKKRRAKK